MEGIQQQSMVYLWLMAILLTVSTGDASSYNPLVQSQQGKYQYLYNHPIDDNHHNAINLGTTLVAIKYKDGVIVGADGRTSMGGYVSNRFAEKINTIIKSKHVSCVVCRSGSAADTQHIAQKTKHIFQRRALQQPGYYIPCISEIAQYVRYCMKQEQSSSEPLQASIICAGYDCSTSGSGHIYCITTGGSIWEEDYFSVSGSGSTLLLGYLDAYDMNNVSMNYTKEEAVELVTKLVRLSIARDGSSGGSVRIVIMNQNGLEEMTVVPT